MSLTNSLTNSLTTDLARPDTAHTAGTSLAPVVNLAAANSTETDNRPLLKVVVVGSVDDGKSTLLGRLLYECDGLYEDQIAAAKARSKGDTLDLSLFTDGLLAEREQGITIDVAWRYLQTGKLKLVLADTPGHVQYTRNMATGASTADAVIILVDARLGVLQQTRRHATIARLLGIPQVCVAINKIDLVEDPAATWAQLRGDVETLLRQVGFTQPDSGSTGNNAIIPVSAVVGDNITRRGTLTPFYDGETVLSWLEGVPARLQAATSPFRFPVQTVLRPDLHYRGYAGPIVSGAVRVGDEVVVLPSGQKTTIAGIDTFSGSLEVASAPQAVVLRLTDNVDVARGDLIAPAPADSAAHGADTLPTVADHLDADLVWFGEVPVEVGAQLVLKHTTRTVRAQLTAITWRLDLDTLLEGPASSLVQNDIGRVHLALSRPINAERYDDNRDVGAFILIDPATNATVAAGMIRHIGDDTTGGDGAQEGADEGAHRGDSPRQRGQALGQRLAEAQRRETERRRQLLGRHGAVVLLPAPRGPQLVGPGSDAAESRRHQQASLRASGAATALLQSGVLAVAVDALGDAQRFAEAGLVAVLAASHDGVAAWRHRLEEQGLRALLVSDDEPEALVQLVQHALRLLDDAGSP